MNNLYYEPPSDKIFEEIKQCAIDIWQSFNNTHGYVDGKIDKIKSLSNVRDNVMYIVGMFDDSNQRKLIKKLSPEARKAILDRLIAGLIRLAKLLGEK